MQTIKITSGLHAGSLVRVLEEHPGVCTYVRGTSNDFCIDWQDYLRAVKQERK
jgi:hypothetical protein